MKVGDFMTLDSLIDKSGILLMKNAMKRGISKAAFYRFVETHHFEKVARGVYLSPGVWEDPAFILHLRYPKAVFSHDEALFYHGLTDHEPMNQTITIYSGYNTQKMKKSGIKVFTVKRNSYPWGAWNTGTPLTTSYLFTTWKEPSATWSEAAAPLKSRISRPPLKITYPAPTRT